MPNIKMTDTTHHRDYGAMRAGTVHAVSDEEADRLVGLGIAAKTSARTTAEVNRLAAEPAEGAEQPAEGTPPARHEPIAMTREDVGGLTGADPTLHPRGRR